MKKSLPPVLSIFSVVLLTASAITLYCGGFMNPSPPKVKAVEAFQRNLESIIVATRNKLLTVENFMAHKSGYQIDIYFKRGGAIRPLQLRTFFFAELDIDHIRDTCNEHFPPLGFKLSEKRWTSGGVELVNFLWTNEEYHAVAASTTCLEEQTATFYYTQGTPTDGPTGNPPQLIGQPGRTPDRFDPNLPPADRK